MKASRNELARLGKVLDGEHGVSLVRLSKADQRKVLDLLDDSRKSRNRIKDANNLIVELTEERRRRATPSKVLRKRIAIRLKAMWGTDEWGWKSNSDVMEYNLQYATREELLAVDANTELARQWVVDPDRERDTKHTRFNPFWYHENAVWHYL